MNGEGNAGAQGRGAGGHQAGARIPYLSRIPDAELIQYRRTSDMGTGHAWTPSSIRLVFARPTVAALTDPQLGSGAGEPAGDVIGAGLLEREPFADLGDGIGQRKDVGRDEVVHIGSCNGVPVDAFGGDRDLRYQ